MNNRIIMEVFDFNKFNVGVEERSLGAYSKDERTWMHKVLTEEADELRDARHLVHQVDACIDSIIFALGGLYRLGLNPDQAERCFIAVMAKNKLKKPGQNANRKVGDVKDAVKPDGFKGPEHDIARILGVSFMDGD